jgi:hypothetical protein
MPLCATRHCENYKHTQIHINNQLACLLPMKSEGVRDRVNITQLDGHQVVCVENMIACNLSHFINGRCTILYDRPSSLTHFPHKCVHVRTEI